MAAAVFRSVLMKPALRQSSRYRLQALSATQQRLMSAEAGTYNNLTYEKTGDKQNVALVHINRPKAFNALCVELMDELVQVVEHISSDPTIGCMVLTGKGKHFSAGADIKEMLDKEAGDLIRTNFLGNWDKIADCKKPIIAAINGFALGGGCEVALMCDIIYAAEKAEFGQPEILIGTIPGGGGTQRLTHAVGKSLSMEMILTGNRITSQQALQAGLVSRVLPLDDLLPAALKTAEQIASNSKLITGLAKDAIMRSYDMSLTEGLRYEKKLFYSTFTLNDRREGMAAFVEKRKPKYTES